MRDEYREFLRSFGVVPETVHLATSRATVLRRVAERAARDGDDFALSPELAAFYFDHFEVPTAAEGPLTVLAEADAELPSGQRRARTRKRPAVDASRDLILR